EKTTGLKLTKYIREAIGNSAVRILLMTSSDNNRLQKDAVLNYDINGYEEKTDLLSKKLYTVVISSLRSYRDIIHINNNKKAMAQIAASSSKLFEMDSVTNFLSSSFCHLSDIVNSCKEYEKCLVNGIVAIKFLNEEDFKVMTGFGKYEGFVYKTLTEFLPKEDYTMVKNTLSMKNHLITKDRYISYYNSSNGIEGIIFMEVKGKMDYIDLEVLDIFHKNITAAFENLCVNKEIEETQREILYILGELTEARSEETGNHVKRVSKYSQILAEKYGLSKREIMLITMAAPIHDVGKVGIADSILMKPGKLTFEEFETVKTHTTIGYNLLKGSNREVLKSAAIIAHEHHERYDGKGYPRGLKANEIHIFGRIVAVADVFDALGSPRVYKKPWIIEDILKYFKEEKGKHFDPDLVDILFDNLDEFIAIKEKHDDAKHQIMNYEL
ncbi:MAG TPA: HD domain-containing phosphohydrolase, partial [Bacteroidales bacterium]|nr:HD domain-containing phosphohydrolase [Bacteroidales bacterium]